jgi:hypothetical protein
VKRMKTDVKEMAIKQLEEKIAHLQATTVSRDKYNNMKIDFEEAECERVRNFEEYRKMEEQYLGTLSKLTHVDAELENVTEMLRDVRGDYVKVARELEHLRPLMVLYMKEKVQK